MRHPLFFRSRGWIGFRLAPSPSRYFVLRDLERHRPLFSERNGYRPFRRILRIGRWEVGWFPS